MRHSPGPWRWNLREGDTEGDLFDGRGFLVLRANPVPPDRMKGVIAAAPEMLELLREFRDRAFEDTSRDWDDRCRNLLARIESTNLEKP